MRTAIILINYNTPIQMLKDCLNSLNKKRITKNDKIILVDNNSKDKEKLKCLERQFKHIDFIFNKKNEGFAGGNNIGIIYAKKNYSPDYFYLLNTDTKVREDFLDEAIKYMSIKKVGIVGSNQRDFNGKFKYSAADIKLLDVDYHKEYTMPKFVNWISGAGLLIRSQALSRVGLFDERYNPAYYEETDLEKRFIENGYKLIFCPSSIIYHKGSGSTDFKSDYLFYIFHRNRIFYFLKYHFILYFIPRLIYDVYKASRQKKIKLLLTAYRDGIRLRRAR